MNLTKEQRKRLAGEMRKLAMECLTNGPTFDPGGRCGCAIGVAVKRARLPVFMDGTRSYLAAHIDGLLTDDGETWRIGLVSIATDVREGGGERTAVVFPLLALADALEESEAPQAPEKSLP